MVTSFLIATLILFVLNLGLSLVLISLKSAEKDAVILPNVIGVILSLVMITWNIFALIAN